MRLNKTYIGFIDYKFNYNEISLNTKTKLKIFDLVKVKTDKCFEEPVFQIDLLSSLNDFCLSTDNKYLILSENLNLCIYRIKDGGTKLMNVPISQSVSQIWTHENNFVNIILATGELITLKLIDKNLVDDYMEQYDSIKKLRYIKP